MPFFYHDGNGKKQGPYSGADLIALAKDGYIFPDTVIETESGTQRRAEEVKGLLPHKHAGFSRAVFIFLAMFVGIFGVHDFYVRRVRYGWIHLALMSPWILAFLVTVLFVFGYSLFILSSASLNKEVRAAKNAIRECKKEIEVKNKERLKLRETLKHVQETLDNVLAGKAKSSRDENICAKGRNGGERSTGSGRISLGRKNTNCKFESADRRNGCTENSG
jgi:TM2 domain-containing membrane protein YozV